jgi:hypothetical protein
MSKKSKMIAELIEEARVLGAREEDLRNSQEHLEYNEYGLSLDVLTTQMHEYDVPINEGFYKKVIAIAKLLEMDESEFSFLLSMIEGRNLP